MDYLGSIPYKIVQKQEWNWMQLNEQNKIALVKMSRNNKQPIERLFHWPIVDYTACSAHCTHTRQSPAISQSRDRCGSDAVKHVNTHTCCHVTWSRNPAWLSGECLDVTYSPSFLSNSHQPRWQPISIHLSVGQLKTRLLPREWHSGVYAHVKKTNPQMKCLSTIWPPGHIRCPVQPQLT